jgi:hypothetical protein
MATVQIADRPASIDGCFQTWNEADSPSVLRSDMDLGGFVKVRRRTTAAAWQISASVVLRASQYDDFLTWFRSYCQAGVLPTRIKHPSGREVVARFSAPPTIEWPERDNTVFRATCTFEQLPEWAELT